MDNLLLDTKRAIILKKPSGTIAIAGNLSKRQKKLYNGFLFIAKKTLEKKPDSFLFSVRLSELKKILNVQEQDTNNKAIRDIIKELHKIDVEYNILGKDFLIDGYASLLDNIEFKYDLGTNSIVVYFSIPFRIRESMIRQDSVYANINLVIVKGLTSIYALTLYEIVKDYENVEIPKMTIEEFRKLFGIKNKYKRIYDVKKKVLDVACDEINNSNNIDFFVNYKLFNKGRKYTHIKFYVSKKQNKALTQRKTKNKTISIDDDVLNLLQIKNDKVIHEIKKCIKEKGKDYVIKTIEYVNQQQNVKNYVGFLLTALQKKWIEISDKEKQKQREEEIAEIIQREKEAEQKLEAKKEEYIKKSAEKIREIKKKLGL